jgi:hypothetical protein
VYSVNLTIDGSAFIWVEGSMLYSLQKATNVNKTLQLVPRIGTAKKPNLSILLNYNTQVKEFLRKLLYSIA